MKSKTYQFTVETVSPAGSSCTLNISSNHANPTLRHIQFLVGNSGYDHKVISFTPKTK